MIQINVEFVTERGRQIAIGAVLLNFFPIQKNFAAVHDRFLTLLEVRGMVCSCNGSVVVLP